MTEDKYNKIKEVVIQFTKEEMQRLHKEGKLKKDGNSFIYTEGINEELRPDELKGLATDLAHSMPNHTKYDHNTGPSDTQIVKAMKKYQKDLFQHSTNAQKKEVVKIVKKILSESLKEGAFWRIPQKIAATELYELTRLIKSINDRLSSGQDIDPKNLDRAVKLLNIVKKSAKKFNNYGEVEGTIYEGRADAKSLLQQVYMGNSSQVEGIKLSQKMANAYLTWLKQSPYGKRFSKLPFDKLFQASFNWGIERYAKGLDKELKVLKAIAKKMKESVNEAKEKWVVYDTKTKKRLPNAGKTWATMKAADEFAAKQKNAEVASDTWYFDKIQESVNEATMQKFSLVKVKVGKHKGEEGRIMVYGGPRKHSVVSLDYGEYNFNPKDLELAESVNEGKKVSVTQDMWDKEWKITKKYGKEFDENLQKRIEAAKSVSRNDDQAEDWAFKNWKQLPQGALKMFITESFSDGSKKAKDRIKQTSEVLGMTMVGEIEEPSFTLREEKIIHLFNEYIKKQGNKWIVQSKAGKTLGTHSTKKEAIKQLAAVEASKKD